MKRSSQYGMILKMERKTIRTLFARPFAALPETGSTPPERRPGSRSFRLRICGRRRSPPMRVTIPRAGDLLHTQACSVLPGSGRAPPSLPAACLLPAQQGRVRCRAACPTLEAATRLPANPYLAHTLPFSAKAKGACAPLSLLVLRGEKGCEWRFPAQHL